ncbi:MAG: hypothetical protein V7K94_13420 [Nostoc sp.]|uniref:hypothetical protein n=1 Tax=Nostoc sp. TaxID=1180 RepID=UPI002FF63A34
MTSTQLMKLFRYRLLVLVGDYQQVYSLVVSLPLEHLQPLALNDLSMMILQVHCTSIEMAVRVLSLR